MTIGHREFAYKIGDGDWHGEFCTAIKAKREAIAEIQASGKSNTTFCVGCLECGAWPDVSAEIVIEDLQLNAEGSDFGGEYAEGWLEDVTPEHKAELESILTRTFKKWMLKYGYLPNWQAVNKFDNYRYLNGNVIFLGGNRR